MNAQIKSSLIAPCGMNCALCLGYQREKNKCPGCSFINQTHPATRRRCRIKNCEFFKTGKARFCFECNKYPCALVKHLDKRYRTKNGMSMIQNLNKIKEGGIRKFIREEQLKWACGKCGSTLCVHRSFCLSCGSIKN
jgi:hypothetical protein